MWRRVREGEGDVNFCRRCGTKVEGAFCRVCGDPTSSPSSNVSDETMSDTSSPILGEVGATYTTSAVSLPVSHVDVLSAPPSPPLPTTLTAAELAPTVSPVVLPQGFARKYLVSETRFV